MAVTDAESTANAGKPPRRVQGPFVDLALHTLGWKAFQDLCSDVCEEALKRPVEIYREAQDGGQDAVYLSEKQSDGHPDVATIQCKFTSKPNDKLRPGSLSAEFTLVESLVANGQASTYVLMTNKSIDAPEAVAIRQRLRELGVTKPHILGSQYLTRIIRSSARLRALVPRVYGLGDLSTILDERAAQQTEALLGHLRPVLSVYVPTQPHVEAVRSLAKHGLVLLLGDPGTGKSTIAAILATVAADKRERQCFRADGPEDFIARWNPNEPGFFWIDDAFGPNQLRDDYVDRWLNIFPKVQAALAKQSQFVLTSRRHIYYAAEVKLGSRTLPWFRDKQAVVNVGALTKNERHQVLYNHIKAGVQSWQWKSNIKPHLSLLAEDANLIPEIARRLADPAYTRQLDISASSLVRFVREPKAHLLQTIREMSKEHRAALTLVFLHNGQMTVGTDQSQIRELVMRHFGIDHESLGQAIPQLRDSFLFQRQQNGQLTWAFKHPTIADAVSAFLGETDGLVELYLRGTRPEVILSEVVCSGVGSIPDSTVVPESLNALLADIVLRIPDEPSLNERLFSFLWTRASDRFFQSVVTEHPELLARKTQSDRRLGVDSRINVHSRAAKFGVLPDGLRYETTARLTVALLDYLDTTFLADNDILGIIPPTELMLLLVRLRSALPKSIQEAVQHVIDEIDYEVEPDEHFYELRNDLDALNIALFGSEEPDDEPLADELRELIDEGVKEVLRRQEEREQEGREDDWDWRNNEPKRLQEIRNVGTPNSPKGSRSVFSDVDE